MHSKLEVTGLGRELLHCIRHISQGATTSKPQKPQKIKNKNKWQIVFWCSAMTTQVIGRKKGRGMRHLCHLIIQNCLDGLSFNSSFMCLFQLKTANACLVQLSVSWQKDKRGNKKYCIMHLCTRRRTKKLNSTHKDNLNRGSNSARP